MEALEHQDPLTILAYQYDIVCNGVELSSGAIRNHRPDIMAKAFAHRRLRPRGAGGAASAACSARCNYGAPPHGGIAPGVDRIVMLLADTPNLREVTAFPLIQQAEELLLGAPGRGRRPAAEGAAHPALARGPRAAADEEPGRQARARSGRAPDEPAR